MGTHWFLDENFTHEDNDALLNDYFLDMIMRTTHPIRYLVSKALYIKRLTPDIENEINYELTRLGYISDADYEALELLMSEMDAGRIQLVPSP